jgi:RNA polymerase sigma-70 factor (ECF subfamily)
MRQAIFGLEPAYREPLVLQVLMGYSVAEVAKLMDITTGAVLIRLFRARKKLAASFCTAS